MKNIVYKAPQGKVYDYANPPRVQIKELDGTITEMVDHLYTNYLSISANDSINNYVLVDEVQQNGKRT